MKKKKKMIGNTFDESKRKKKVSQKKMKNRHEINTDKTIIML